MRKSVIFLLSIFMTLVSCGRQENTKKESCKVVTEVIPPYNIDLEKSLDNVKPFPLSIVVKELEYIPLETKPVCLLDRIDKLELTDSNIFISDFDRLLQFDRGGKFIRQIGKNGRGPGEYIHISDFCVDRPNKKIYVIAWSSKMVLEFDTDGKFIRSFDAGFPSAQFLRHKELFYFHLVNGTKPDEDYKFSLYFTDTIGNISNRIKKHNLRTGKPGLAVAESPMYLYDNEVRFMEYGTDTLYTLKNGKSESYAVFNLGSMKMDPDPSLPFKNPERDQELNALKQKLWIRSISEAGKYLLLTLDYGLSDSSCFCLFDKLTREVTFSDRNGLDNDIDGGSLFWPESVYNDSLLIDYCESALIKKYMETTDPKTLKSKFGDKYFQLAKIVNELDELDNPVVVIAKCK